MLNIKAAIKNAFIPLTLLFTAACSTTGGPQAGYQQSDLAPRSFDNDECVEIIGGQAVRFDQACADFRLVQEQIQADRDVSLAEIRSGAQIVTLMLTQDHRPDLREQAAQLFLDSINGEKGEDYQLAYTLAGNERGIDVQALRVEFGDMTCTETTAQDRPSTTADGRRVINFGCNNF